MEYIRLVLRYISYIITALVVLVYLLGAFSPWIPPSTLTFPAFLGLMMPFLFGLMVLVTLYWAMRLKWRELLALALVYALSWPSLMSYFPINRSATAERLSELNEEQRPIKILSYNVGVWGFGQHSARKPNPTLLYLKGSEADIICLQEALLRGWGIKLPQIQAYLGNRYPYIRFIDAQEGGASTLMVLSRFPITDVKRLDIDSPLNGAAAFTLDINGQPTTLINLHLESFRLQAKNAKSYLELAKQGEATELTKVVFSKMGPTFVKHQEQAEAVRRHIDSVGSERLIVCGDFNDTPVSYALAHIGKGLENAYSAAGNGLGFSFRSRYFKVRIDHILLGQAFRPIFTEVDKSAKGSDHFPIYTYVLER